jgi:hypothetical protein
MSEPITDEPVPVAEPGDEQVPDPGLATERDRLARLLRETRLQLSMTQARLAALEGSSTLELGRTLVRAARRPWPRGAQLPRDLFRMWRSGGAGATPPVTPAMLALATAQLSDLAGGGERMLSALTAPGLAAFTSPAAGPAPGLVIAGVLTARTGATLSPDAIVQPLLPHDADVLLESSGADLVLIEAAAVLAGSAWAYAVDPAAADRGRRLGRLIATARTLGKPVIFVGNAPAHLAPGLDWVAASCDAVSDDDFGVQLALFHPEETNGHRDLAPVYAAARDPREAPALRALLDAITGESGPVRVAGQTPWQRLPALYREHGLFVTATDEQARAQRACGARVIMAEGPPEDVLARVRDAVPPGPDEVTATLRDIFQTDATPVRLAALARLAGLPPALITGRQIAVRVDLASVDAAPVLAAALARQRLRPAEVMIQVDGDEATRRAVAAAVTAELPAGTAVTVTAAGSGARTAARPRSPFAASWDPRAEYPDTYLLDLACARECAQAHTLTSAVLTAAAKEQPS